MLRACRRVLRPGGRSAFLTIVPSPGLSSSEHRRAVRLGPRAAASTRPIDVLVEAARFVEVEMVDVTEDFHRVARAWLSEFELHEGELREILGDEFDERQSDRRGMLRGIEEGLLRRYLVLGTAPND